MRREPDFDDTPRKGRRGYEIDAPRPLVDRRPAKRGKRPAPVRIEFDWSWLPSISLRSPMLIGAGAFIVLAASAGLIQGGHLSLGGADTRRAADASAAWFPIGEVVLSGQYHTREADLKSAIGIGVGGDMLDVEPEAIRVTVEALDWIDSAEVARLWPATLTVTVTEKEPYALWQSKGVTWLIDRKGETITKDGVAEFAGLPLVVGDGAPQQASQLIDILKRFPAIQRKVKASVRVGDRRWDLHLKNGIQVRLPEDGIEDALHRLTVLQQEQKIFERDIESVDLRLPDRMVVKPRGGAAEAIAKGEAT